MVNLASPSGETARKGPKKPANKLDAEKMEMEREHHDRIQKMQTVNRQKEIDLIRPQDDMRLLRLKYKALENTRAPQPMLKQNYTDHVKTLYDQEAKYLGERAELYRGDSYNPYVLKEHIDCVKEGSAESRFSSENNPYITSDLADRPKLFGDKALGDFKNLKRAPLENTLLNPHLSAQPVVQENGLILQQTVYGDSYNTKKYLQENELVSQQATRQPIYEKIDESKLKEQNVVLKSRETRGDEETADVGFPRQCGPIPPEPYEPLYCNYDISEMSDGYFKRAYPRVYNSPNVTFPARYVPLKSDLDAMRQFEEKQMTNYVQREAYLRDLHQKQMEKARKNEITHLKGEMTARRELDKENKMAQEQTPQTTYSASYTNYRFDDLKKCPPNEFYKDLAYSSSCSSSEPNNNKPADLIALQDGWSRTSANRQFHSAYQTRTADLRDNIRTGKKKTILSYSKNS
jgi:hypothetical protein